MKRSLVVLSAIAMFAFAAQAQAAGDMYAGVKAGVNIANVGGSDAPDNTSSRTGFQGGLFIGKHVNDQFGFRVEGLYVQKGAKGKASSSSSSSSDVTEKLDYIEFPILFVYDIKNTEKMGFNLFAGPTLGFNMSAKVESTDIKDNIQSFEFGGAIGAGVEKKMAGGKAITFDARYSMGATTVAKDVTVASTTVSPDIKNRGFGFMLGYQIPIGSSQ
ncbi:MAG TPA: porin family protein [Candidatus Krumholzibacteria bacterium]|nr:porin family protein [Candidatus Krumholzibacteria bacterium]